MATTAPDGEAQAPTGPRDILLARHGETDHNVERRFQGRKQVPLNDNGRRQAAELAVRVEAHGPRVIWTSPLIRASETARIVGERLGLVPIEDERLAEVDVGDWTDLRTPDIEARDGGLLATWRADEERFTFPGGEAVANARQRGLEALGDIAAAGGPALVVSHGMLMRLVMEAMAGGVPGERMRIGNGLLYAVDGTPVS
ncbi:MAG TPA: histidine phosphatase family protein [Candidatus Dormibacteraeota bacterium]|nr:histidine phosphatase family protein [Candidatus Dormibacteraeota bacterium]